MPKIEWIPVKEVLKWGSVDGASINGGVKPVIKRKQKDEHYKLVRKSLKKYGFRKALRYSEEYGLNIHGDGHHRLAAAISLGYKMLPYIKYDVVAYDSGDFDDYDMQRIQSISRQYIHPANPLPENVIKGARL